ncbi:unnamed protein product [Rotaria sp. Silwood1]|nr:unnamed protein product [Rotaria sp. Silwood1]
MTSSKQPAVFVTHGAGPCWFMDSNDFSSFAGIDKNSAGAKCEVQLINACSLSFGDHVCKIFVIASTNTWLCAREARSCVIDPDPIINIPCSRQGDKALPIAICCSGE